MYPNLFRAVPSDEPMAPAVATVMQYYGWRQITVITEEELQFVEVYNCTVLLLITHAKANIIGV